MMLKKIFLVFMCCLVFVQTGAFAKEDMMSSWEDCVGFKVVSKLDGESLSAQYRKNLTLDKPVYLSYRVPFAYVNGLFDDDQLTYAQLQTWPYVRRIEINKGNSYYETCYDERKQKVMQKALNSLFGSKGPKKVYEHLEVDGVLYDKGKLSKKPVQYQAESNLLSVLGFLYGDSEKTKQIGQYKYEQFTADFITKYSMSKGYRCERYSNDKECYTYIFANNRLVAFAEGGQPVNTVGIIYNVEVLTVGGFDESILQIPQK